MTVSARVGVVGLLVLSWSAHANVIPRLTLKDKFKQSRLVAIGKVTSTESIAVRGRQQSYAVVLVAKSLRGPSEGHFVKVVYATPFYEGNPSCCDVGAEYLFFLKPLKSTTLKGFWESTNGPYGVYRVDAGTIHRWTEDEETTPLTRALQDLSAVAAPSK